MVKGDEVNALVSVAASGPAIRRPSSKMKPLFGDLKRPIVSTTHQPNKQENRTSKIMRDSSGGGGEPGTTVLQYRRRKVSLPLSQPSSSSSLSTESNESTETEKSMSEVESSRQRSLHHQDNEEFNGNKREEKVEKTEARKVRSISQTQSIGSSQQMGKTYKPRRSAPSTKEHNNDVMEQKSAKKSGKEKTEQKVYDTPKEAKFLPNLKNTTSVHTDDGTDAMSSLPSTGYTYRTLQSSIGVGIDTNSNASQVDRSSENIQNSAFNTTASEGSNDATVAAVKAMKDAMERGVIVVNNASHGPNREGNAAAAVNSSANTKIHDGTSCDVNQPDQEHSLLLTINLGLPLRSQVSRREELQDRKMMSVDVEKLVQLIPDHIAKLLIKPPIVTYQVGGFKMSVTPPNFSSEINAQLSSIGNAVVVVVACITVQEVRTIVQPPLSRDKCFKDESNKSTVQELHHTLDREDQQTKKSGEEMLKQVHLPHDPLIEVAHSLIAFPRTSSLNSKMNLVSPHASKTNRMQRDELTVRGDSEDVEGYTHNEMKDKLSDSKHGNIISSDSKSLCGSEEKSTAYDMNEKYQKVERNIKINTDLPTNKKRDELGRELVMESNHNGPLSSRLIQRPLHVTHGFGGIVPQTDSSHGTTDCQTESEFHKSLKAARSIQCRSNNDLEKQDTTKTKAGITRIHHSMDMLASISAEIHSRQKGQNDFGMLQNLWPQQQNTCHNQVFNGISNQTHNQNLVLMNLQKRAYDMLHSTDEFDGDEDPQELSKKLKPNNSSDDIDNAKYNYKKLAPGVTPKNHKRIFVQHVYQDHSLSVPSTPEDIEGNNSTGVTSTAAFPLKLHETLSFIEKDGYDDIIGWLPHGRSFKIHKQDKFVEIILPKYFIMTKKSSFLRQLNLYGFNRISGTKRAEPLDTGSYYHEKFLRGVRFLTRHMSRQKVNGNGIRSAGNPEQEPDFSLYPMCSPKGQQETSEKMSPSKTTLSQANPLAGQSFKPYVENKNNFQSNITSLSNYDMYTLAVQAQNPDLVTSAVAGSINPENVKGYGNHIFDPLRRDGATPAQRLPSQLISHFGHEAGIDDNHLLLLATHVLNNSMLHIRQTESGSRGSHGEINHAMILEKALQVDDASTKGKPNSEQTRHSHKSQVHHPENVVNGVQVDDTTNLSSVDSDTNNWNVGGPCGASSFPWKLQRILDKLESDGNTSVISWLSHGRAFIVHNVDRFVNELMPLYFNQTKYSSFQRQLHMYSFRRITSKSNADKGAYYHFNFLRGLPKLSLQMQRTRVNGKRTRKPGNPSEEPNFHTLSPLPGIQVGTSIDIPIYCVNSTNNNTEIQDTQSQSENSLPRDQPHTKSSLDEDCSIQADEQDEDSSQTEEDDYDDIDTSSSTCVSSTCSELCKK